MTNKPKPAKQDKKAANVAATYFLAKHSGLFRPGQPLIVSHTLPQRKSKGKPK